MPAVVALGVSSKSLRDTGWRGVCDFVLVVISCVVAKKRMLFVFISDCPSYLPSSSTESSEPQSVEVNVLMNAILDK